MNVLPENKIKLGKLWAAMDKQASCSTSEIHWKHLLGEQFDLIRPMLISSGDLAEEVPDPRKPESHEWLRVVRHDSGRVVGVSPDDEVIALSQNDIRILNINVAKFDSQLAQALGLTKNPEGVIEVGFCRLLGYLHCRENPLRVYLLLAPDQKHFSDSLRKLLLGLDEQFILLTTTKTRAALAKNLESRTKKLACVSLEELIVMRGDFSLASTTAFDAHIEALWNAAQRDGQPRLDGVYPPKDIVFQGEIYKCVLSKRQADFVTRAISRETIGFDILFNEKDGLIECKSFRNTKSQRNIASKFLSDLKHKLMKAKPEIALRFVLNRFEDHITRVVSEPQK